MQMPRSRIIRYAPPNSGEGILKERRFGTDRVFSALPICLLEADVIYQMIGMGFKALFIVLNLFYCGYAIYNMALFQLFLSVLSLDLLRVWQCESKCLNNMLLSVKRTEYTANPHLLESVRQREQPFIPLPPKSLLLSPLCFI